MTNCAKSVYQLRREVGFEFVNMKSLVILTGVALGKTVPGENLIGMSSRTSEKRRIRDRFVKRQNKLIGQWVKRNVGSREVCNFVFYIIALCIDERNDSAERENVRGRRKGRIAGVMPQVKA